MKRFPTLSTFFLREASERLGKPDIQLSSQTLDVFSQYWWPGNVRQLRNEIQRAVALSAPGGHDRARPPLTRDRDDPPSRRRCPGPAARRAQSRPANLAAAVEEIERDLIQSALNRSGGNISETARTLGLTRRGLYLKLRRLGLESQSETEVDVL